MNFEPLAARFRKEGGRYAFGVPGGGESLRLVAAIESSGGHFLTTGHETTAALMAGALSRLTSMPALAISIKGPGFANLLPGLLSNSYEGYPHVSFSEAYAFDASRDHKRLDHAATGGALLRAHHFYSPAPGFIADCWREACREFPGPVHVDLAPDRKVPEGPKKEERGYRSEFAEVVRFLEGRRKPVLLVGSLALRSRWRKNLSELTLPVFTTAAAKGALPETGVWSAGVYTGDGKPISPEKALIPQADLVVAVGVRSGEVLSPIPPHARCLVLDTIGVRDRRLFPPDRFGDRRFYLDEEEFGELFSLLKQFRWGDTEVGKAHAAVKESADRWAWSPTRAIRTAQLVLPTAIHVLDTGNFTIVAEHFLRIRTEAEILGTPNGRFMGAGLGYALGACLNTEGRPVVLWIGDGGLRAFSGELALAVENGWKLLVLVMKDGFFGSIRSRAVEQGLTMAPLTLKDRHFARVAEQEGMFAAHVRSEADLAQNLADWNNGTGPGLLECEFDPDIYNEAAGVLR